MNDLKETITAFDFLSDVHAVGGSVRDLLIGRESDDVDLATSDVPSVVRAKCNARGIRVIETGIEHGTLTALMEDGTPVEITTFRKDVSTDGRRATVEFAESVEEDLARRDFTINAIAMNADGDLIDPYNGQAGIRNRVIRTVGDPFDRFREDFLRIIRASRFMARYGFWILPETKAAQRILADQVLENVSIERVMMEMQKAFKDPKPSRFLKSLNLLGILGDLISKTPRFGLIDQLPKNLRMEGLLIEVEDMDQKATDLRISNDLRDRVLKLQRLFRFIDQRELTEENRRRFQFQTGDLFESVVEFSKTDIVDFSPDHLFLDPVETQVEPIIQGRDLIDLGFEPGPKFGEALEAAHEFQLKTGETDRGTLLRVAQNRMNEENLEQVRCE